MSSLSATEHVPSVRIAESKFVRLLAITLIAIGCARMFTHISFTSFENDFCHYYIGGSIYASGKSPYTEHLLPYCVEYDVPYDEIIPYAAHPPLIQWTFGQLSQFSMPTAFKIWFGIQLALLVSFLELTRRLLGKSWTDGVWLLLLAVFMNSTALQSLIHYAQVQVIIGLSAYGALYSQLKGRSAVACGLITFASAFKIYPVVLAPWFLFAGVKKASDVVPRLISMAAVSAICILVPGYQTWIGFATEGVSTLSENAITWSNYSVQCFVAQLMNQFDLLAPYARTVGSIASLILISSAYAITYRRKLEPRDAFCVLLVASTVGGFIAWPHYMTLMLLPICVLLGHAKNAVSPAYRIAAVLAGIMILLPQVDETFIAYQDQVGRILLHFYPLLGIALMVGLIVHAANTATQARRFSVYP